MRSFTQKPDSLQQRAATVLLAMIVYQLGACPCGCLEHNAWAELLGADVHHHEKHPSSADDDEAHLVCVAEKQHFHDCTREAAAPYLNNTRTPSLQSNAFTVGPIANAAEAVPVTVAMTVRSSCGEKNASIAHAAARCRPALQVYRV